MTTTGTADRPQDRTQEIKPVGGAPRGNPTDPRWAIQEWLSWRMFRLCTVQDCWPLPGLREMVSPSPVFEPSSDFVSFIGAFVARDLTRLVADGRNKGFMRQGRGDKACNTLRGRATGPDAVADLAKVTPAAYSTRFGKWGHDRLPDPPTGTDTGKWPQSVLDWCSQVASLFSDSSIPQTAVWRMPWLDLYASNQPDLGIYAMHLGLAELRRAKPGGICQVPEDAPPQVYGWVTSVLAFGGSAILTPPSDEDAQIGWMNELNAVVDDM